MSKKIYEMDAQTGQQYLKTHEICLNKYFLDKGCTSITLQNISRNNKSHIDFSYNLFFNGAKRQGSIECKQDSFVSDYMVIEMYGSVDEKYIDLDFISKQKSFNKRLSSGNDVYEYLYSKVKEFIEAGENRIGLKKGYCLASEEQIGLNSFFCYYNRAFDKWSGTIKYKHWYIFNGNKLRQYAHECFDEKKHFLIVVPNKDNNRMWVSICILIPYKDIKFCTYEKYILT